MLDKAFDALTSYDWGGDRHVLDPIDEAVVATHGNASARKDLETRLAAVLGDNVSRDAKEFVCRKLMVVGTAVSVPSLAALLHEPDYSHMARYALERIPAPEAAQAMRDNLPKLHGELKVGVISSLGVRQDETSVPALANLLGDADPSIARAAAFGLGAIRSAAAAKALVKAAPTGAAKPAVADASLACAEGLLRNGKKDEARAIYQGLTKGGQPKHVLVAATRGLLACAGK